MRFAPIVAAFIIPTGARAQSLASTETPAPASEPAPVRSAPPIVDPLPGDESGRTDREAPDSLARRIGRGLLYLPKLAVEAAFAPVRAGVWAEDRYHLDEVYYRTFYNADRTIGLYPTGTYASGYGITAGARFSDHQLFGAGELVALQATTGEIDGESYHDSLRAQLDTGHRLGRVQLATEASFDRRPNDPFYGIGNADLTAPRSAPVDPRTDDLAISARYRYQESRVAAYADARLVDGVHARLAGALADHRFAPSSTGVAIDEVYAPAGLTGWTGFANAYGELELRLDTRRRASLWEPRDLHTEGSLAALSIGRVHELDGGAEFWRGSAELQHFIRFATGPRLLALRARGEAVSGSTSAVPFSELPMLGGGDFLRGYDFERFRDRISLLGSAEYVWDLAHWFDAAIYVDAGRVYSSVAAIDARHLRVGYGVALEVFNDSSFLFEASLSSSIDGGLFLDVTFNPVFDNRPRWR